jgi:DNA repair protein RecN (Recombination protein N)
MLVQLQIQNYAIIDSLTVAFADGLNIITGETGAGKSIVMGALGLVLGNRADSNVLLDTQSKCVVEAHFNTTAKTVEQFILANELDSADELGNCRKWQIKGLYQRYPGNLGAIEKPIRPTGRSAPTI